ncbi:hypothetical protein [Armatimonas sp.]|uniref:hypothetical protein n=1 Tax=Armatimonas sp. TaxID=1872638 RepID=UPI00374FE322
MNTLFRIAFGDYEFVLDRTSLTYSLTETVTKTVWATELSLGWIELKERETGALTRTDFGDCKLLSIAEKMGATGKRILLGLDAPGGVPVDIYLICGSKEIQLTVEASRDSKTHTLEKIGLLPRLCLAGMGSALVLPHGEGKLLRLEDYPFKYLESELWSLPIWEPRCGLTMPFMGVVQPNSALALLTDSLYGFAEVTKRLDAFSADLVYECDPERRRLDIRILLQPGGDHISIARAYREKLIGERNHITLRKKLREQPALEPLIGKAFVTSDLPIPQPFAWVEDLTAVRSDRSTLEVFSLENPPNVVSIAFLAHCLYYLADDNIYWSDENDRLCRWDRMEHRLGLIEATRKKFCVVGISYGWGDWAAFAVDFCLGLETPGDFSVFWGSSVPLHSVVWRDSVLFPYRVSTKEPNSFLQALLRLAVPLFDNPYEFTESFYEAVCAILCPLHALTFPAFLTAHKFLTPDFLVEEAYYSDKTQVIINQSETDAYDAGEYLLPPGGFYVRHPQFEAHDALRVKGVEFPQRAWRVRRSLDSKPLEQSGELEEREFLAAPPPSPS